MRKKIVCLLLAACMAVTALTGCGNGSAGTSGGGDGVSISDAEDTSAYLDPENPTTITFYSYSLATPSMKGGMEHLIDSFNETVGKEKGVVVESVADETYTKYMTDLQAGNQVDVVQMPFSLLDNAKTSLGFQAYDDIFPAAELQQHLEGISENAQELGKLDGKMYALAFTFSRPILYNNNSIFEAAGLDPADPPATWEEMLETAKIIKEKTGKNGLAFSPANGWVTEGIIYSAGSDVTNEDRTEAVFANENTFKAFETWKEFYTSGVAVAETDAEAAQEFMAGNAAMHIQSTSILSGIIDAANSGGWELSGAPMPGINGNEAVPVNSGSCLAVHSDSQQKTAAIWEFVKYVTGDEGYTIITSEIGYLPLRTYLADDPNYLKRYVDQYPLLRINLEQLEKIRPVTIWPGKVSTEVAAIFTDAVQKALTTDADVADTLTKAQDDINEILASQQ